MIYSGGRYNRILPVTGNQEVCKDENLDRRVCIHWFPSSHFATVQRRLAAMQAVRSPYVALVYDLVQAEGFVGVVEEELGEVVAITDGNRLLALYQFCSAVSALHELGLAHGALIPTVFRDGPLGAGRLGSLAFGLAGLDAPLTDGPAFIRCLHEMGADQIGDQTFQVIRTRCVSTTDFDVRPLCSRLLGLLLRDRHRALLTWRGDSYDLNATKRSAQFTHPQPGVAAIRICYDGTRFFVEQVNGEVRINNIPTTQGAELPGSCVVVLGNPGRPWSERYSVTFDQSHPEVH